MANVKKPRSSGSESSCHRGSAKSTMSEWYAHSRRQYQITRNRGTSAEKILMLSDRMRDAVSEVITHNKRETEMRLEERISDIRQAKAELEKVSVALQGELEVMQLLKERIRDGIQLVRDKACPITEKCIQLREGRTGIDLSHDEVEKELEFEQKKITGAGEILTKAADQTEETMRLLRAALYLVNKDIEHKLRVLSIECDVLNMKETSLNLSKYEGEIPLNISNITVEEWAHYTDDIMESSRTRIHSARQLQTHINELLKEVIGDLRAQFQATNSAFQRRIDEIKDAKAKLQNQHYEITRQVNDMNLNIAELQTSINEKEAYLGLAHTRLKKRANRQGIELVKDEAEATLIKELIEIQQLLRHLQEMVAKAQLSLRTLLKTQINLEEEINIKTHCLKIDEVDCMSVRHGIEYYDI